MKKILFCDGEAEIAISDRSDGNMRFFGKGSEQEIIENQSILSETIELQKQCIARINTRYNRSNYTEYHQITDDNIKDYSILLPEHKILVSDGLISTIPEIGLLLPLADCLGMVFFDRTRRVIGLLHAGRHNLEQYGPKKFVECLQNEYHSNPSDISVYFSPYARNYEVFQLHKKISEVAVEQLLSAGILAGNITDSSIDTMIDNDYPSNSLGDKTERFAIAAKMKNRQSAD